MIRRGRKSWFVSGGEEGVFSGVNLKTKRSMSVGKGSVELGVFSGNVLESETVIPNPIMEGSEVGSDDMSITIPTPECEDKSAAGSIPECDFSKTVGG